ncbi:hypothetical protein [Gemmatimonas sp.]|uniref:hypothetical protein n=1 Tax=Gemmatimonas sp. TaxID=1962908 RepID=UPI0025C055EB|nr:hypothetical protein [Gemmatimonas sp.]MCA2991173.1 hypothetical protein [Gemmatimonas sp.]
MTATDAPTLFLAALTLVCVVLTWMQWQEVQRRERQDRVWQKIRTVLDEQAKQAERKHRSLDLAMTDDRGRCWICTAPANPLELYDTGDRHELACLACAQTLKTLRTARQEM